MHCDLKLENICARVTKQSQFKFTLIDFGVASKLPKLGVDTSHKTFRGNFSYATPYHIINKRPCQLDDLLSLLYVAY